MDLLALHDPVYVVDLTPETMAACREDFDHPPTPPSADEPSQRPPPEHPIRAIALLLARDLDPVLLSIRPTVDTRMLDTVARLIRSALLTRRSIASLVTEAGDDELKRLYFSRALPRFVYDGAPAPVRHRIPEEIQAVLGRRRSRRAQRRRR